MMSPALLVYGFTVLQVYTAYIFYERDRRRALYDTREENLALRLHSVRYAGGQA